LTKAKGYDIMEDEKLDRCANCDIELEWIPPEDRKDPDNHYCIGCWRNTIMPGRIAALEDIIIDVMFDRSYSLDDDELLGRVGRAIDDKIHHYIDGGKGPIAYLDGKLRKRYEKEIKIEEDYRKGLPV
jgi:hypothetical protein